MAEKIQTDQFFEGPGGEFAVCKSLDNSQLFEVHNDHAGTIVATTADLGLARKLAELLSQGPFTIKALKESSE